MDITYREIREFGESIIALDQHPSQISMSALILCPFFPTSQSTCSTLDA